MQVLLDTSVFLPTSPHDRPLTRPATAGKSAVAVHPLPRERADLPPTAHCRLPIGHCLLRTADRSSMHRLGGGSTELDFLHEKHEGDHGEEGEAEEPETVGIGQHVGLTDQVTIDEAMSLVERLHGV